MTLILYILSVIVLFAGFGAFSYKRLLTYLHALQQEDYDNRRLLNWMVTYKVFDKRLSAVLLGVLLLSALLGPRLFPFIIINLILGAVFGVFAKLEKNPCTSSKKVLVLTQRAKRILWRGFALCALLGLLMFFEHHIISWIIAVHLIPIMLVLANFSLAGHEKRVQKKFYDEAVQKLNDLSPTIIAITGSYGKTSVKHILGHILKTAAPSLVTPGSVNTVMGITRIIREQLEPNHQFFVVEMGAYGPGSIATLCKLTPPDHGIITAIGQAHYERFKTLDTVAAAKFELAQAVLEKNGKVIVHEQTLEFAPSQAVKNSAPSHFVVCGDKNENDLVTQTITQTAQGLEVSILWGGKPYTLKAPLYGLHHGHNIALAFAAALSVGLEAADVITALTKTPQITHRLEVKPQNDGTTIIDDAYNSNPKGFNAALELLPVLRGDGRAILVTPGIVELGPAHDLVHREIGAKAAQICDIVIAVNPSRIPTFIEGFEAQNTNNTLLAFDTFTQAQNWLRENKKQGDIILLENDLPDLYERIPHI